MTSGIPGISIRVEWNHRLDRLRAPLERPGLRVARDRRERS
jgi:hypothetical protein